MHEFQNECVLFFGQLSQVFNIPRSVGQIYGLLFASPTPQSFTDIVDRLKISKGSASQGLQLLRSLRAVRLVESADSRRQLFAPELSLRKLVDALLREKVDPVLQNGTVQFEILRKLAHDVKAPDDRSFYQDRVSQIGSWRSQLRLLLPVLKTLLAAS